MAEPVYCILLVFTLIFLSVSPTATKTSGKITVNQSLTATTNATNWLSPKGDFAFGFQPYPKHTDLFLLAIWYAKIPDTIVWYPIDANNGNPVPEGSTVTLNTYDGLVLNDPNGNLIWKTRADLTGSGFISYGFLNDTGNLVLITQGEVTLWQSFDHPRDTLLPTQVMESGMVVNSRLSETNFTKGRFQMQLLTNGKLVLNTRDLISNYSYEYYHYDSSTDTSTDSNPKVIYEESGNMYILLGNGSNFNLTKPVSPTENYLRATLDFDGVLTWYYHPKNSERNDVWHKWNLKPDNICGFIALAGSGICGYNSFCSIGQDQRPTCKCPESYSLTDPNDTFGSCEPDHNLNFCHKDEQAAKRGKPSFVELQGVDWPTQDYAVDICTEDVCKSSCLNDCFCAAAIYERTKSQCWKKKLPLTNGRLDSSVTRISWLKVGSRSEKNNRKLAKAFVVLLVVSASVTFLFLGLIGLRVYSVNYKRKFRRFNSGHNVITLGEYSNVICFSYEELQDATKEFEEELGRGAFGVVYKGVIKAGGPPIFVAVKKLHRISEDADKEFKTEVNVIGQTHHKNLVRLVGFCKDKDQRLLVYEYMSNGNLANYLFGEIRPNWISRIQIAQGVAAGLSYLHEECDTQIIHCDIKPQNVLLDDNHSAHIADFGLAKLLALNQTQTNTMIRGTKGYVAPEWFRNKPVTVKVDVYSFGVLLLEIICCRKSVCMELIEEEAAILTDWAFDCYQSNRLDSLVNDDMEALNDIKTLTRFVKVALWCIQEDSNLRPTMKRVMQMLEGVADVPSPPSPTSFSVTTQP
ncbi:hypothetical protein BVRB_4g071790 [Beta vulgaris subsp. vulgaris]|nr:hypothetical protein BVRB_4g071790 [Beta vulgaris subsp. vulgaris]